ncbi:hypothetical protein ABZZ92_32865 [Streptomyces ardesiacus]|uniref:hypothetical protein n=1 Tax=Streptomyces ardesiacus TaxID=285564 RepID=UPI0033AF9B5D
MADTSQPVRRAALFASGVALLGLLTACGSESATSSGTPEPGSVPPPGSARSRLA